MALIIALSVIVIFSPFLGYWLITSSLSPRAKIVAASIAIVVLISLPLLFVIFGGGS